MNKKITLLAILCFVLNFLAVRPCFTEETYPRFTWLDNQDYSILFETTPSITLTFKQVRITGIKALGKETFVSFTSSTTIKPVEGLVLLSAIKAIYPVPGPNVEIEKSPTVVVEK